METVKFALCSYAQLKSLTIKYFGSSGGLVHIWSGFVSACGVMSREIESRRSVGKRDRIQLRTLLNKNDSVIECIFSVGASFYTYWEQREWYKHEQRRSETSGNQTYLTHIQSRICNAISRICPAMVTLGSLWLKSKSPFHPKWDKYRCNLPIYYITSIILWNNSNNWYALTTWSSGTISACHRKDWSLHIGREIEFRQGMRAFKKKIPNKIWSKDSEKNKEERFDRNGTKTLKKNLLIFVAR
jgi:hypothetical protein